MGAVGMVWSTLIVNVMMSVFMIVDLKRRSLLVFCLDWKLLRELLNYSLPLVPHSLSYNITFSATRVLINSKLSLSVLGLFSLASQFGYVSDIILNSFQSAFMPWFYDMMEYNNDISRERIRKATYSLMWIMGLIYILVGSFSQEAIYIMADREYWAAWRFVPVLVVSVALKAPLYFYTNFLYYDKSKTRFVFIATLVACILNITFTWLLIPYYGVYGSIIADIISMIIRVLIIVYLARKISEGIYSFVKLGLLSMVPVIFLAVAMLPSYIYFGEGLSITMILYKLLIIFVYIVIVLGLNKSLLNNIKIINR
jgi:O-antigen/teichoic acid export membrane protein